LISGTGRVWLIYVWCLVGERLCAMLSVWGNGGKEGRKFNNNNNKFNNYLLSIYDL